MGTLARMRAGPLLLTKIEPPRIRPGHVPRSEPRRAAAPRPPPPAQPGLGARRLGQDEPARASGCPSRATSAFAWLSLDEEDNDPARFWAYVAAALRKAGVDVPGRVRRRARGAWHRRRGGRAADPAQRARDRAARARLRARRLPRHPGSRDPRRRPLRARPPPVVVALVIATRAEPPVESRACARAGELGEIVSDQLRLQRRRGGGAAQRHARARRCPTSSSSCCARRRRAGRPGSTSRGCRCAIARPRPRSTTSATTATSSTTSATRSCPPRSRRRARSWSTPACSTASAPRCATRCAATSGRSALLGEIERANLFLVPLDERREWFRYHHVFREVLRARARGHLLGGVRRRAARPGGRLVRRGRATSRRRSPTCSRPGRSRTRRT